MKVVCLVSIGFYLILQRQPMAHGARVLAVLPVFSKSHHTFFQPVLNALAMAGHEVVVYSPYTLKHSIPNYTDVVLENVATEGANLTQLYVTAMESPPWKCVDQVADFVDHMLDEFVHSRKIQTLLSSKEHFDVIFTEFFSGQEFILYLGHVFKAPVIGLQSFLTNNIDNSVFGNSLSLSFIPDICTSFSNKMTFYERALNSVYVLRGLYYVYYQKYLPNLEYKFKRYFPDAPSLLDMNNNVSLVFVNDHLTADYSHPRTANIIPVAGIHIQETKTLPEPIKRFMDGAVDGVIFFSLGNNVPDELRPRKYFDMYINVFRQLRQRVLWKTRKENIQGLSDNVMTVKWVPQQDILVHPNCVLFITHCGLLSTHEAVHYGIPVIAIPHLWDQHRNGRFFEEQGVGVRLEHRKLSESNIRTAIRTVLDNPEYEINMKKLSRIFRDRPMTPAQTVVYWTEYVLRHGASHLRPASTQLSWYQLALLDVLAVIIVVFVSVLVVIYLILKKILQAYIVTNEYLQKKKNN